MEKENFDKELGGKTIKKRTLWGERIVDFDSQLVKVTTKHWLVGERIRQYRLDEINPRYEIRVLSFSESGIYFVAILIFIFILLTLTSNWLNISPIIIFGILTIVFILPKKIAKERIIEFKTRDEPIWIYLNRTNENVGLKFTENLVKAVKNYFVNKYGYVDSDLSKEIQFENYRWLLQNDFISEEKYLELKSELKNNSKNELDE